MPTGPDPWCSLPQANEKVFTQRVIVCLNVRMFCLTIRTPRVLLERLEQGEAGSSYRAGMVELRAGAKAFPALAPYQPQTYRFPREAGSKLVVHR